MSPRVLVSIITYNSAREIGQCLDGLRGQTFRDFRAAVWDNASQDGSAEAAGAFSPVAEVLRSPKNTGFAGGHNGVVSRYPSEDYALFLNPDVRLAPDFLERCVETMDAHPECGSLSPRVFRMEGPEGGFRPMDVIDSTGIYWTRCQRHLDRGGDLPARGAYPLSEYVFGVTGAAAFYRRACLEDAAVDGEIWDEDFFLYREDADLAWRAVWRGWRCIYAPDVTAWHVRKVLPQNRRCTHPAANYHSVKNRFLLRLKNMHALTFLRFSPFILARDAAVLGGVLLRERTSLPAFGKVARLLPRFRAKRRAVMGRRKIPRREMERWFTRSFEALQDVRGA